MAIVIAVIAIMDARRAEMFDCDEEDDDDQWVEEILFATKRR